MFSKVILQFSFLVSFFSFFFEFWILCVSTSGLVLMIFLSIFFPRTPLFLCVSSWLNMMIPFVDSLLLFFTLFVYNLNVYVVKIKINHGYFLKINWDWNRSTNDRGLFTNLQTKPDNVQQKEITTHRKPVRTYKKKRCSLFILNMILSCILPFCRNGLPGIDLRTGTSSTC